MKIFLLLVWLLFAVPVGFAWYATLHESAEIDFVLVIAVPVLLIFLKVIFSAYRGKNKAANVREILFWVGALAIVYSVVCFYLSYQAVITGNYFIDPEAGVRSVAAFKQLANLAGEHWGPFGAAFVYICYGVACICFGGGIMKRTYNKSLKVAP